MRSVVTMMRRRDALTSRERLLRAATKVFSEYGPDGTSVAMLSYAAKINRRMIYHYFGNKEGLYRAVMVGVYKQLGSAEVELAHLVLPVEMLLEKMVRAYYNFLSEHPELVRLLSWENLRHGRTVREMDVMQFKAPVIEALRIALARGRKEGRFRKDVDERQLLISSMALSFFISPINIRLAGGWGLISTALAPLITASSTWCGFS